ncbi:MAG TPA: PKD domain-containing protein [Thermoplasmatales archaeon]|nr:PKD domain-containing protein [Thermoplasmatales archaeon]
MRKTQAVMVVAMMLAGLMSMVEMGDTLDQPFPVYGYITDADGTAIPGGVEVVVSDLTRGTSMTEVTQSDGYYQADLFELEDCTDGDTIEVYCQYGSQDNAKTFVLDISTTSKSLDFSLVGTPSVSTGSADGVGSDSTTLHGSLTDLNDQSCQVWFQYGKTTSYGSITLPKTTKYQAGDFSASLSGLDPDTTYHYRAVAGNSRRTAYGQDRTFTTGATPPQVSTRAASGVGYSSATLNGYLSKAGAQSCQVWFVYDTVSHSSWQDYAHETSTLNRDSSGSFSISISGLSVDTAYHYRAVASNSAGTVAGDDVDFTTRVVLPSVSTGQAENVSSDSAVLKGTLSDLGGAQQCSVWFEYGTTTAYGQTTEILNLSETGGFALAIASLEPGTVYHYRAVAHNQKGTAYGTDGTLTTAAVKASVETGSVEFAVVLSANVTGLGGDHQCQVWFEYAAEGNQTPVQTPVQVIDSEGPVTQVVTGLEGNRTYHYRAVINNSQGPAYGANLSFKMLSLPAAPEIETGDARAETTSASLNGTLSSLGAGSSCYVWFEYWTTHKQSTVVSLINGTGHFQHNVTGLRDGTLYYYRAIAVSDTGRIAYGDTRTFTTQGTDNGPPSVTLLSPANDSTVDRSLSLRATVADPDGDTLTVTFYLNGTVLYAGTSPNGTVSVAVTLDYGAHYTWQVEVDDGRESATSPLWHLTTVDETGVNFTHTLLVAGEAGWFNDSSPGDIQQWEWDFGDGAQAFGSSVSHVYQDAGTYTVTLSVTDGFGNVLHKSTSVTVWKRGDANLDGAINALDLTKIQRIADGLDDHPDLPHPADADGNGTIDEQDVDRVIDIILGWA